MALGRIFALNTYSEVSILTPTSPMPTIRQIIAESPYGEDCKKALRQMLPDFQAMGKMKCGDIERIRHGLHLLHGARHPLIQGTLFVINRMFNVDKSGEPDNHLVSDHAFCMGLSRYLGFDLAGAKDAMLKKANRENWRFAYGARGSIKTFLPQIQRND